MQLFPRVGGIIVCFSSQSTGFRSAAAFDCRIHFRREIGAAAGVSPVGVCGSASNAECIERRTGKLP
jgi:hypothetical protein